VATQVEGDAAFHLDAEVLGAGPARLQRLQQLRMSGDSGAAADQLHRRAFENVHLPPDLAQEGGSEQARHGAADDDGAARGSRHARGYYGTRPTRPEDLPAW